MKRFSEDLTKGWAHLSYHLIVVILSAAFAWSLPITAAFLARNILKYWSFIGNDKLFLLSVEMVLAVFLVLLSNTAWRSWKDRRFSVMARTTGLVYVTPAKGFIARRRIKKLRQRQGVAREVMVIASTGFRSFADPNGELHDVIRNCREAKLMLLNPGGEGVTVRAKSILNPNITPERLGEQIGESIRFLRGLRAAQKNIRLKLYPDPPFLKLSILGDYLWIQHYHAGLDVQMMPRYVFRHDQNPGGLYVVFYQYFLMRWNLPDIPEYDLDADALVYRDTVGNELRRESFEFNESRSVEGVRGVEQFCVVEDESARTRSMNCRHLGEGRGGEESI
jgi:hypothetical protein